MASSQKQLHEELQEQQKPFVLNVYLSERRIMLNRNTTGKPHNSKLSKRKISQTRKILKLILCRFICRTSHGQQVSNCVKTHHQHEVKARTFRSTQQKGGTKGFSVISSSVAFLSSLESPRTLKERVLKEQEATAEIKLQWESLEENEQLDEVSILNQLPLSNKVFHFQTKQEEGTSTSITIWIKNTKDDTVLSVFLWEQLITSLIEKHSYFGLTEQQETIGAGFTRENKNRRVFQQNMHLLLDCIHEAIETYGKKNIESYVQEEFVDLLELGKTICEQILSWCKQNASQNVNFDIVIIIEGWDYLQLLSRKLWTEIGNFIMDDIIQETIDLFIQ